MKQALHSANYNQWLFEISRQSFSLIPPGQLVHYHTELREIFEAITYLKNDALFFNELYDQYLIQIQFILGLAFSIKRELQTASDIIPQAAELLIAGKLKEVEKNMMLYPDEIDSAKIFELNKNNENVDVDFAAVEKAYQLMKETLEAQGMGNMVIPFENFKAPKEFSLPVRSKNNAFHYLPYNFGGSGSSGFEIETFRNVLRSADFVNNGLEIYYNGERGLTEFVINCFAKQGKYWKPAGKYTTDFLIIKRKEKDEIYKALLIETKGSVYALDPSFQKKKNYIETEFLQLNADKFGYRKFDFYTLKTARFSRQRFETEQ